MGQPYGYIYFIFVGYRVAIGKTTDLYKRRTAYQRTHFEIYVIGLIPCQSKQELDSKEKRILIQFQKCNAFRDLFYLTPEMRDWIVENTEPYTTEIKKALLLKTRERNNKLWRNPEYRRKQQERKQRNKRQSINTKTLTIPGL